MAAKWIEALTGSLEEKKQYKQDKARIEALPEPYATAAQAIQRYFMYDGGITDGDALMTMFDDLADLWERAAVDGTRSARSSATTRWSSPRPSCRPTPASSGSTRSASA